MGMKQARAEDWRMRFRQFEVSGLSVTEFCRRHKLTESSFYQWKKRLQESRAVPVEVKSEEVKQADNPNTAVELLLPGGVVLRCAADPAFVGKLVRSLAGEK